MSCRQQCAVCGKKPDVVHKCSVGGEWRCKNHQRQHIHPPTCPSHLATTSSSLVASSSSSSSSSFSTQPTPIFTHTDMHHPLTTAQRYGILILHLIKKSDDEIATIINCHIKSVRRWIHHLSTTFTSFSLTHTYAHLLVLT